LAEKAKAPTLRVDGMRLPLRTLRARRRRAAGFTTVEVLVAVAIVILISTLAILGLGGSDRARLTAEAADVGLFLQEARMRALEGGRPIEIVLSAKDGVLVAGAERHVFDRGITVSPEGARLVLQPSGENQGLDLTLGRNNEVAHVRVDWLTGKVEVR
jgi:type II secretory pathway pseudopilin PulG